GLLYGALYVLPVPLVLVALGLPLMGSGQVPLAVSALAEGLVVGGWVLCCVEYAWVIVRSGGIAEVFFVWRDLTLRQLRRLFKVMRWAFVPAVILLRMWEILDSEPAIEATRFLLGIVLAGVAYFAFQ